MKKLYYLIILTVILGLVLTGCLLTKVGQVPTSEQSGITYLTKTLLPLPSGLVGLWHLDDDANDSSVNSNNGDVQGANYVEGKFGKALSFDGDDYVNCGNDSSLDFSGGSFTISLWIYPTELGANDNFLGRYKTNTSDKGWLFRTGSTDGNEIQFYNGTTNYTTAGINILTTDNWQQVVVVYNGDTYKFYHNGSNVYTSSSGQSGATDSSNNLQLAKVSSGYYFNGKIDEVRIWNIALSSEDIFNLPAISVEKSGPDNAAPGEIVIYTYEVTNIGDCVLSDIAVSDDPAGDADYVIGDNDNGLLEDGETWTFTVEYTIPTLLDDPDLPEYVENTATASGSDEFGIEVTATDSWRIRTMCARTIGYWKNHEEWCDFLPEENSIFYEKDLITYFPGNGIEENGVNPLEMLRAQLLAAELNIACFDGIYDYSRYEEDIYGVIDAVEVFLSNHSPESWPTDKKLQQNFMREHGDLLALKDVLDIFNNMGDECFEIEEESEEE